MIKIQKKGVVFYKFRKLSKYKEITHFVSTIESGNMSFPKLSGDEVVSNITNFLSVLGVTNDKVVFANQVHSNNVTVINDKFVFENISGIKVVKETDALVTKERNFALIIKTADCVPTLIYDPSHKIIAAVHAGWRGTLAEIVKKTVVKMNLRFNSKSGDLIACIGPSLGPKDFFIRKDVYSMFAKKGWSEYLKYQSSDQWLLDSWGINKKQLIDAGVLEKNIEMSDMSTLTSNDFFSHRAYSKDPKKPHGRFITGIMLK